MFKRSLIYEKILILEGLMKSSGTWTRLKMSTALVMLPIHAVKACDN